MNKIGFPAGVSCGGFGLCAVLMIVASTGLGDGYRNPPSGATALGRGGVRLTQGDDPSVIMHNPANLMDFDRPEVSVSSGLSYSKTEFTASDGTQETSKGSLSALPGVYAVVPLRGGRWAAGLAVHSPFSQCMEWEERGVFCGIAPYYSRMVVIEAAPTLAVRLGKSVAAGFGLNVMWSQLEFRQMFPWLPLPQGRGGPLSRLVFEGDGLTTGWSAGLTFLLSERQRLAVFYRAPVDAGYEGRFKIENPPPAGALPPGATAASDFETELHFPTLLAFGYGVWVTDKLRLEGNVEWLEHSRNDAMRIDIDDNNVLLEETLGSTSLPQDWEDTWTIGLGADWHVTPCWVLRGGWTWLPTPVPEETVMPVLPDAERHILGIGVGFRKGRHSADVAYNLSLDKERSTAGTGNPVEGAFDWKPHLWGFNYAYRF